MPIWRKQWSKYDVTVPEKHKASILKVAKQYMDRGYSLNDALEESAWRHRHE